MKKIDKLPYAEKIRLTKRIWYYFAKGKWHRWKVGNIKVEGIIWIRAKGE